MSHREKRVEYSVIRNGAILIVWLTGDLYHGAQESLDACWLEVDTDTDIRFVFLDLGRLGSVNADAIPAFTKFQKQIRAKQIELRVCGMSDELKERLAKKGVLRLDEVSANLKTALANVGRSRKLPGVSRGPEKKAV